MKKLIISSIVLVFFFMIYSFVNSPAKKILTEKPKLCISFDDGDTEAMPGYSSPQWNALLLAGLKKHDVQAIFFIKGKALNNNTGKDIIESWNKNGHLIA